MKQGNILGSAVIIFCLAVVTSLFLTGTVRAENSGRCQVKSISSPAFKSASNQAVKLKVELDKSNSDVVLISRVGSDLSRKGLKYTHVGIAWRETSQSKWQVTHLLNHCGQAVGGIFQHGLIDFYLDDPFSYDSLIMIPKEALTVQLKQLL